MINRISFRRIRANPALTTALSVSALVLIAVVTFYPERASHAANHKRQQLSFEDRVEAQRAIEAVYWRRRVWPTDNPQPKPPLDEVLPDDTREMKWLEEHKHEYAGQWVALDGDRLIAASPIRAEISVPVKADGAKLPLITRIPAPDEPLPIGI